VDDVRRKLLIVLVGLPALGIVLSNALAATPTYDIRDVPGLRRQLDQLAPGPNGPPQLVPPPAPGPRVNT
jgi:hypothetical protein